MQEVARILSSPDFAKAFAPDDTLSNPDSHGQQRCQADGADDNIVNFWDMPLRQI